MSSSSISHVVQLLNQRIEAAKSDIPLLDTFVRCCRDVNYRLPSIYRRMGGECDRVANMPLLCSLESWLIVFESWGTTAQINQSNGLKSFAQTLEISRYLDNKNNPPENPAYASFKDVAEAMLKDWDSGSEHLPDATIQVVTTALQEHGFGAPLVIWLYFLNWLDPSATTRMLAAVEPCPSLYEDLDALVSQLEELENDG
jgi:hypothetical protein